MDDQSFEYYPPQYNTYPSAQYQQPAYDSDYVASHNNPFVDHGYPAGQTQDEAQAWSPFEPTNSAAASLQRRGAVSDGVPPEGGATTEQGGLRVDIDSGDNSGEHHVHEVCVFPFVLLGAHRFLAARLSRWPKRVGMQYGRNLGGEGSGVEAVSRGLWKDGSKRVYRVGWSFPDYPGCWNRFLLAPPHQASSLVLVSLPDSGYELDMAIPVSGLRPYRFSTRIVTLYTAHTALTPYPFT